MAQPQLYTWYSAEQAISFFGRPAEAQPLCNGQWLIFAADVVCMTEIGTPQRAPHFKQASRFAGWPISLTGSTIKTSPVSSH
jgi:hypothetical protein